MIQLHRVGTLASLAGGDCFARFLEVGKVDLMFPTNSCTRPPQLYRTHQVVARSLGLLRIKPLTHYGGLELHRREGDRRVRDFALEIRMELLRVRPAFDLPNIERLVKDISRSYRDITRDNIACGVTDWQDFYNFTLAHGVALVTIFRKVEVEVLVFAADDSLIRTTDHLAMIDVDEFLKTARNRFHVPDVGLRFPMSQILPWLERVDSV